MIAQQPAARLLAAAAGLDHRRHEVVIRRRLVRKASARGIDRDIAGLAALVEMRKRQGRAVGLRHQRHRYPRGGICHILRHRPAGALTELDAVAAIAWRRRGTMGMACAHVAIVAFFQLRTGRKAAASQHHAPRCGDLRAPAVMLDDGACHPAVASGELDDTAIQLQIDAALLGREGKCRDQAIAVGEARATLVAETIVGVTCRHTGDVHRRTHRPSHLEYMRQVVAA